LTGEEPNTIPSSLLTTEFKKAAGVVALIPATREGTPWSKSTYFKKNIDWQLLLGKGVTYEVSWSSFLKEGDVIQKYNPSLGAFNSIGALFLSCDTPEQLVAVSHRIVNNLESLFSGK